MIVNNFWRGFTLIELMLTMTLISILASLALPNYWKYKRHAKIAEGLVLVTAIQEAIADYYSYHGKFPENNQMAGLPEPEKLRGQYVESISVEKGAIHLRYFSLFLDTEQLLLDPEQKKIYLTLRPALLAVYPPNAVLLWLCGYQRQLNKEMIAFGQNKTNIKPYYLPTSCQEE